MDQNLIQGRFCDLEPRFITDRLTPEQALTVQLTAAVENLSVLACKPQVAGTAFRIHPIQTAVSFESPSKVNDNGYQYLVCLKDSCLSREGLNSLHNFDISLTEVDIDLDQNATSGSRLTVPEFVQLGIAFVVQDSSAVRQVVTWIVFRDVCYLLSETGLLVDKNDTPAPSEVHDQLAKFFEIFNWLSQPPESADTGA